MPLQQLMLLRCPFCKGRTGQISIDVPAFAPVRRKLSTLDGHCDDFVNETFVKHGVVVFNSAAQLGGPCEHLIHILIDFDEDLSEWSACYGWKSPDMDAETSDYFWDTVVMTTHPTLVPKTRCKHVAYRKLRWQVGERAGVPVHLVAEGQAWFTANRKRFIEELRKLQDRYQELVKTEAGSKAIRGLERKAPRAW
jgi:hypothetical protein